MAKGLILLSILLLSVDAYAEEEDGGDSELPNIIVVCDAACQDQGGGGGGSGGTTHGGGDTPVGDDPGLPGGGSLGVIIPPGAKFALNRPNNPNPSASRNSEGGVRTAHAQSDLGFTRSVLGPSSILVGRFFVTTYNNGQREVFVATGGTPSLQFQFGCG